MKNHDVTISGVVSNVGESDVRWDSLVEDGLTLCLG
jgi:hypothetical protein